MGIFKNQFPALSINLINADYERIEINRYALARTKVTCNWQIGLHIQSFNSYTAMRQATREFTGKVQNLLTTDETISGTFSELLVSGTEFAKTIRNQNSYLQKNAIINVQTINFVT
mgnify:CR=1 FL=1